jgi:hypothetical protein
MSVIPLRFYITSLDEQSIKEPAKWTCDAATVALKVVNAIWSKATVTFVIRECVEDKPLYMAKSVRNNDQRVLDVLTSRHSLVHIYFVNPIENLAAGGSSCVDGDPEPASFVQWYYSSDANGRAPGLMNSATS